VHMLGYFFDPFDDSLVQLLISQRATRITRIADMAVPRAQLGLPVGVQPLLNDAPSHRNKSIGRPALARAMIAAGHVATTNEAFEGGLGPGPPGFDARAG